MDFVPFPSLVNSPLSSALVARDTECPLSAKMSILPSAVLSQSPSGLWAWAPYHFFSDPGPRNDQRPCGNLRANSVILRAFGNQFSLFPRVHQSMSLYMILPLNCSGSHLYSALIVFWISSRIPNVVNPGNFFHSIRSKSSR